MRLVLFLIPGPHLLPRLHERLIPYFEPQDEQVVDAAEARTSRFPKVRRKIQEAYRALMATFPLHERLCTALGRSTHLEVRYPASLNEGEACYALEHFLIRQVSKHRLWRTIHLVLAGLGSLLMPLPGPNFFFFYPAVRAFSHHRAASGAAAGRALEKVFRPEEGLVSLLAETHHLSRKGLLNQVEAAAASLKLPGLPEYYQRAILHKKGQKPIVP